MWSIALERASADPNKIKVIFYTKAGCHLCDDARTLVERVTAEVGVGWTETDIDADPALRAEFAELVPVVRVDGKELGYWRIDEDRLRRALR